MFQPGQEVLVTLCDLQHTVPAIVLSTGRRPRTGLEFVEVRMGGGKVHEFYIDNVKEVSK